MAWSNKQRQEFLEIMAGLSEVYEKELSKKALKFYIQMLEAYDFEAVKAALNRYVRNASGQGAFFPKPGDIIALIEGAPEDRAEKAWAGVLEALERVGTWKSVRFRDPVVNVCIAELGGWIRLGELTYDEIKFLGHEFRKLYRFYAQTGQVPKVDHLPGRIETENNARGYQEALPLVEVGAPLPAGSRIALVEKPEARIIPNPKATVLPQGDKTGDLVKVSELLNQAMPERPAM